MRKLFAAFLILVLSGARQNLEANVSTVMESKDPIPILPSGNGSNPGHRTPAQVPIQCYYSDGELTFTFSAPLGIVECEVIRVSDNEVFDGTLYAVSGGTDSLYVSTDADDYEITLTCADGTIYYGEYSIE